MSSPSNHGRENSELRELLHLTIPADPEAVASASDAVAGTLEQLAVPEQKRLEIMLAVQEALTNAVAHGCDNDSSKNVACRLECDDEGRILIIVSDPGPGFDPDSVAAPTHGERLHADHGRGVYLIRQLMDEVRFARSGSEIRMWKY
ncbi:MAG TPA: ATP-binding protein [Candidatus Acidoferrales bacterium]|nr:ATP-binding protein [Candidatus Acidoferrales bacterium]